MKQVFVQLPFDFKVEAFSVGKNLTGERFRNSAQGITPGKTVSLAKKGSEGIITVSVRRQRSEVIIS